MKDGNRRRELETSRPKRMRIYIRLNIYIYIFILNRSRFNLKVTDVHFEKCLENESYRLAR